MNPVVSIITPAFNAEEYITEAIESIINQTFKAWELLVIDDGSKDRTAQIVRSFSDERIILIQQKNAGVSSARNRGLELVKGKYITFLDADDILPLQSLESRVAYLEAYPEIDLVDGKISVRDADMQKEIRRYEPYYNGLLLDRLILLDSRVFFNVCYLFKKEILGDTCFKEKMTHAEDLLFYIELSNKHHVQYGFVNEDIYWYRSGHTSAMTNLNGLEVGYLSLIAQVKRLSNISCLELFIFRLKIAKIMVLSWLREKEVANAIKSIFSYMFIGDGKCTLLKS